MTMTETGREVRMDHLDADLLDKAREIVGNTAPLLDANYPGWATIMDLSHFDIGVCSDCVVGQLAPSLTGERVNNMGFSHACRLLINRIHPSAPDPTSPELYGFEYWDKDEDIGEIHEQYDALQVAWTEAVDVRV